MVCETKKEEGDEINKEHILYQQCRQTSIRVHELDHSTCQGEVNPALNEMKWY